MSLNAPRSGTGLFDDEDNSLMTNEAALELSKQEKSTTARNFILFFVLIIIVIISINRNSFISSRNPQETKAQLKKQLLQPIMQQIKQDERALNQNVEDKNQTFNIQRAIQNAPTNALQIIGYQEQEKKYQNSFFQPEVPSSPNQQISSQRQTLKTENNKHQEGQNKEAVPSNVPPKTKVYPISQEIYDKRIYAGEIHYSRVPVEYWEHRILMLKAMGLNTLSVYVMWNYHQIERDRFDYSTQNKNITKFLQLTVKHKMKVLLRPGPYICGEWDFGGLPARLLGISGLTIRSYNKKYLDEVEIYFQSLAPLIKPYLLANNGPIQMIQIQNQLGSFSSDRQYAQALVDMWKKLGIQSQYYIEDAAANVRSNYFNGAAIGISDGSHEHDYSLVGLMIKDIQKDTLIFGGEIYTGWMTHWGERWGNNPFEKFRSEMEYLFQTQKQFSLYMAHGGTNFGLTAGANAGIHEFSYEPMITSYDYNATISEQGRQTVKSDLIVDLMKMYVKPPEVPFPDPISTIKFDQIYPQLTASLLQNLGEPAIRDSQQLYFFQHEKLAMYRQGIIVYETFLEKNRYVFRAAIRDFGLIFLDGLLINQHSRIRTDQFETTIFCNQQKCRLLIAVEAMGHNNYGANQGDDIKGLIRCQIFIAIGQELKPLNILWNFYKINIDESIFKMSKISNSSIKYPAIFKQQFNLPTVGDTYINMENYNKGYLWINGRNLGRYWSRGPQFRLYCPGVWLKRQNNEIVILEFLTSDEESISGAHTIEDKK